MVQHSIRVSTETLLLIRTLKGHFQKERPNESITDDQAINISLRLVAYGTESQEDGGIIKCQKNRRQNKKTQ